MERKQTLFEKIEYEEKLTILSTVSALWLSGFVFFLITLAAYFIWTNSVTLFIVVATVIIGILPSLLLITSFYTAYKAKLAVKTREKQGNLNRLMIKRLIMKSTLSDRAKPEEKPRKDI